MTDAPPSAAHALDPVDVVAEALARIAVEELPRPLAATALLTACASILTADLGARRATEIIVQSATLALAITETDGQLAN